MMYQYVFIANFFFATANLMIVGKDNTCTDSITSASFGFAVSASVIPIVSDSNVCGELKHDGLGTCYFTSYVTDDGYTNIF